MPSAHRVGRRIDRPGLERAAAQLEVRRRQRVFVFARRMHEIIPRLRRHGRRVGLGACSRNADDCTAGYATKHDTPIYRDATEGPTAATVTNGISQYAPQSFAFGKSGRRTQRPRSREPHAISFCDGRKHAFAIPCRLQSLRVLTSWPGTPIARGRVVDIDNGCARSRIPESGPRFIRALTSAAVQGGKHACIDVDEGCRARDGGLRPSDRPRPGHKRQPRPRRSPSRRARRSASRSKATRRRSRRT